MAASYQRAVEQHAPNGATVTSAALPSPRNTGRCAYWRNTPYTVRTRRRQPALIALFAWRENRISAQYKA